MRPNLTGKELMMSLNFSSDNVKFYEYFTTNGMHLDILHIAPIFTGFHANALKFYQEYLGLAMPMVACNFTSYRPQGSLCK